MKEECKPVVTIPWADIFTIWEESKEAKGLGAWWRYHWNYGTYRRLVNFGAEVVNEYNLPFQHPRKLK